MIEDEDFVCPRCGAPFLPVEVTHRQGLLGKVTGGVGLTIFGKDEAGKKHVLFEAVDEVKAWACRECDGLFLGRPFPPPAV